MKGNFGLLIFGFVSAMALVAPASAQTQAAGLLSCGNRLQYGNVSLSGGQYKVTCDAGYTYVKQLTGQVMHCNLTTKQWADHPLCRPLCQVPTHYGSTFAVNLSAGRTYPSPLQYLREELGLSCLEPRVERLLEILVDHTYQPYLRPTVKCTVTNGVPSFPSNLHCVWCRKEIRNGYVVNGVASCNPGYIYRPSSNGTMWCDAHAVYHNVGSCFKPCVFSAIINGNISATGQVTCQVGYRHSPAATGTPPLCRDGRWTGFGSCNNIDECKTQGVCGSNAKCTDTPGDYMCTCNDGYHGNGYTCTPCRGSVLNGNISRTGQVTCELGYYPLPDLFGDPECLPTGNWIRLPLCPACFDWNIKNGRVTQYGVAKCQTGYYAHYNNSYCIWGKWYGVSCRACGSHAIPGGTVSSNGVVTCHAGHYRKASGATTQCVSPGMWKGVASCPTFNPITVRLQHPFQKYAFRMPYGHKITFQETRALCHGHLPGLGTYVQLRQEIQDLVDKMGERLGLTYVNVFIQHNHPNGQKDPHGVVGYVGLDSRTQTRHALTSSKILAFPICVVNY